MSTKDMIRSSTHNQTTENGTQKVPFFFASFLQNYHQQTIAVAHWDAFRQPDASLP